MDDPLQPPRGRFSGVESEVAVRVPGVEQQRVERVAVAEHAGLQP